MLEKIELITYQNSYFVDQARNVRATGQELCFSSLKFRTLYNCLFVFLTLLGHMHSSTLNRKWRTISVSR